MTADSQPAPRIAVTGSSGLIGRRLVCVLRERGYDALPVLRRSVRPHERAISWDPITGRCDPHDFAGLAGVIHLAGENIAAGRWTAARKAAIRDSRVVATRLLAEALARATPPPPVLVCASGINYYGDGRDAELTEASPPGSGFLPDVCIAWENACIPAASAGVRVVNMRNGVVLSRAGGALVKMLPAFRWGVAGRLGRGTQYLSWIDHEDAVRAYVHALDSHALHGPLNVTSPQPVTNAEFTRTLGQVLNRPTAFAVPAFALRLLLGEIAGAALLASTRAVPARLLETGFTFEHPDLAAALRFQLAISP